MKAKSDKMRRAALRLIDAGCTPRAAAEQLSTKYPREKVAEISIRRWVAKRDAKRAAQAAALEDDAPESDAPNRDSERTPPQPYERHAPADLERDAVDFASAPEGDALEQMRQMSREARQNADVAKRDGNHLAAQRYLKNAADLTEAVARIELALRKAGVGTGHTYTDADVAAARKRLTSVVTKYRADAERTGGLVCAHCGRGLRIAIASGETDGKGTQKP